MVIAMEISHIARKSLYMYKTAVDIFGCPEDSGLRMYDIAVQSTWLRDRMIKDKASFGI